MSTHLIQLKIDLSLKEKLQRVAISKGLTVTSYIKMTLTEATENDRDFALTENGFTEREERRLLASIREGQEEYKKGNLEAYNSMEQALKNLAI